jgi:hypothetical protein
VLARGLAIRPQLFTYTALAAELVILDLAAAGSRRSVWLLWCLPPFFVVWVNLHGGFVLGIAVLALFAAWSAVVAPQRNARPLLVWLACVAATLINPYGWSLLVYLWDELSRPHPITEWRPVVFGSAEHAVFFVMLGLFLLSLPALRQWRSCGWRVAVALVMAVFALRQQRHTAVFALCAAAPLAAQAAAIFDALARRSFRLSAGAQRIVEVAVLLLALAQLAALGARLWRDHLEIVYDPRDYPVAAVAALKAGGAHGNLAVPLDWGAYVLWHLSPQIRPSIDGRFATVYPVDVVDKNFSFHAGDAAWRRLLDDYPTEAALLPRQTRSPISREPGWREVYEDSQARLYVRDDRLANFALQPAARDDRGIFP